MRTGTAGLNWDTLWHISWNCWSVGCREERHSELLGGGIPDSAGIRRVVTELCKLDCVCTGQERGDGGCL